MASNIFSRLLPPAPGEPSIYETLRQDDDDASDLSDFENDPGMILDVENLAHRDDGLDVKDERVDRNSIMNKAKWSRARSSPDNTRPLVQTKRAGKRKDLDDLDDEVPHSLLIEDEENAGPGLRAQQRLSLPPPISGPSTQTTQAKWQTAQREQRLHQASPPPRLQPSVIPSRGQPLGQTNPKERATWLWANVDNLDQFLHEVYEYYIGHGIWSILLSRIVKLL